MKQNILIGRLALIGATCALLGLGSASTGHAWSLAPSFSNQKQTSISAGRDYTKQVTKHKYVNKTKTVTKNSNNRTNSHNIEGGAQNSVLGDYSVTLGHFANASTKTGSRSASTGINVGGMAEKSYLDLSIGGDFGIGSRTSENNNYGTTNNNNTISGSYNAQE